MRIESLAALPLLRAPHSWPFAIVAAVAMVLLAALDGLDAVVAVRWSQTGSPVWLATGVVTSLLLFYVYASSLRYADLALVTMGWIVILQVALVLFEHAHAGLALPPTKWAAIVLVMALQCYLVVGTPS